MHSIEDDDTIDKARGRIYTDKPEDSRGETTEEGTRRKQEVGKALGGLLTWTFDQDEALECLDAAKGSCRYWMHVENTPEDPKTGFEWSTEFPMKTGGTLSLTFRTPAME